MVDIISNIPLILNYAPMLNYTDSKTLELFLYDYEHLNDKVIITVREDSSIHSRVNGKDLNEEDTITYINMMINDILKDNESK